MNGLPFEPLIEPRFRDRADAGRVLAAELSAYVGRTDLIVLAGWMHIFTPVFLERLSLQAMPVRMINLHPALPGLFPGAHGIRDQYDAFQRGEIMHGGCIVHDVIPELDAGPVIGESIVPIRLEDSYEDFSERLHVAEHKLLVACVKKVLG